MRIGNPTFGLPFHDDSQEAPATKSRHKVDWRNDPIIFFGNSKPNSKELMQGLIEKLGSVRRIDNVSFMSKPQAGVPATAEMIEYAATNYKIAVLGSAD